MYSNLGYCAALGQALVSPANIRLHWEFFRGKPSLFCFWSNNDENVL